MIPIRDSVPSRYFPMVTVFLIVVNLGIFVMEWAILEPSFAKAFFSYYALVPGDLVARWSYEPMLTLSSFLTYQFLHGSWFHVIANMWSLWLFGDNVEDQMGPIAFLMFYLVCGVVAAVTHILIFPESQLPVVGASGAVSGVMGAYMFLYPTARLVFLFPVLIFPVFIEIFAIMYFLFWFLGQFFSGTVILSQGSGAEVGGVAFWAHIGGFLAGLFTHRFFLNRRQSFGR